MIAVDLLIVAAIIYAAYAGTKRGMVLIGLELACFIVSTAVALLVYQPAGTLVKQLSGLTSSLSDVTAFVLTWMIVEIICSLIVRYAVLPHVRHDIHFTRLNRIGGGVLNALNCIVIVALALIVFAGLPLSAKSKNVITNAQIPRMFLASTNKLQSWLASGLGRDLGQSLDFFTVTAQPESQERVELGFTTTGTVDTKDEAAMLVLLNHERASRGFDPLTLNTKTRAVARAYSIDMFARGYFSHINPEGKNPFDRMKAAGVKFDSAGENLALAPTLALAHQGLMNSPGHRANILSPHYRTVGIGIIDGGPYGLMITQDFTD